MLHDKFLTYLGTLCEGSDNIYSAIKNGYMAINSEVPQKIFNECAMGLNLLDDILLESDENVEQPIDETYDTIGDLDEDYELFVNSMSQSNHPEMLQFYSKDEYRAKNAKLFKLKGLNAGFAVASDGDIISVHNNSSVRGLGKKLIELAIKEGGSKLDHFDMPALTNLYSSMGFKEYNRMEWDDQYAPNGWRYEKYGRPDVVERKL